VLEVLYRRTDGYHELRTVIQTIDLHDTLELEPADRLLLEVNGEGLPPEQENLVTKAAHILQEQADGLPGARMRLSKAVPIAAGLGGGSSDAAAALRGLNELWGLALPLEALVGLAARLGSDVPFFVHGGTALAQGRGERVAPLPDARRQELVIALPPLNTAQKTRRMYSLLRPTDYTDGSMAGRLADAISQGKPLADEHLFNVFDKPAFRAFPELERLRRALLAAGARAVHLVGSGPALFAPVESPTERENLTRAAAEAGAKAFAVASALAADSVALEVSNGYSHG
jgi:4-diphosphocytidyl-2-C-methyl-D-erythritol kinase